MTATAATTPTIASEIANPFDVRNSSAGIVAKRSAHSLYILVVGAGIVPFLGLPAPCSVRYHEPLTFILLEGAHLIEKLRECPLLPTV